MRATQLKAQGAFLHKSGLGQPVLFSYDHLFLKMGSTNCPHTPPLCYCVSTERPVILLRLPGNWTIHVAEVIGAAQVYSRSTKEGPPVFCKE